MTSTADTITLGQPIKPLSVTLVRDCDFFDYIEITDGTWPVGLQSELVFTLANGTKVSWAATVTSTRLTWDIDLAEVNAVIAGEPTKARLTYRDGPHDLPWAFTTKITIKG